MKVSSSTITRQKLIDVATEVFGELGYKTATVRDIVQRAGVNQASINYHFRGKDALYLEAVKQAFRQVDFLEGVAGGAAMTPERQLRTFLEKMITSLCAAQESDCKFTRLVARELAEPSGVLEQPAQYHEFAINIVRQLFPAGTDENQIKLATFWLLAQCSVIEQAHALIARSFQEQGNSPTDTKKETLDFFFALLLTGFSGKNYKKI